MEAVGAGLGDPPVPAVLALTDSALRVPLQEAGPFRQEQPAHEAQRLLDEAQIPVVKRQRTLAVVHCAPGAANEQQQILPDEGGLPHNLRAPSHVPVGHLPEKLALCGGKRLAHQLVAQQLADLASEGLHGGRRAAGEVCHMEGAGGGGRIRGCFIRQSSEETAARAFDFFISYLKNLECGNLFDHCCLTAKK